MDMISGLFINSTILVSFLAMGSIYMQYTLPRRGYNSTITRINIGIYGGILGCILMIYSIRVSEFQLADFKLIVILLLTIHYHFLSATIATSIFCIFRVAYFGITPTSLVSILLMITLLTTMYFIRQLQTRAFNKWIYGLFFIWLYTDISLYYLNGSLDFMEGSIPYFLMNIFIAILIYNLQNYFTDMNEQFNTLRRDSRIDNLTGLLSYSTFKDELQKYLAAPDGLQYTTLLFIDLDDFKKINDTFGHLEGDQVLRKVAIILSEACGPDALVTRRSGDEFVVLLKGYNHIEIESLVIKIKNVARFEGYEIEGITLPLSLSIGVVEYSDKFVNINEFERAADQAMYEDKLNKKSSQI